MARAGLGMTAEALAAAAGVSKVTLSDFEIGKRSPHPRTLSAIRAALESAGVEFTNGDQPGVRMSKTTYSIEHLSNVVARFKRNLPSKPEWQDLKFEGLNNGFELWIDEKRLGKIIVLKGQPVFDPPLAKPRTRADGWVTEDELRYWAQSLRLKLNKR
jgi:transcriptional regulator with XRE-family HTH domain